VRPARPWKNLWEVKDYIEVKDLYIIGAGGFGREVAWLVERINSVSNEWNLIGFIDDNPAIQKEDVGGYPVIGNSDFLITTSDQIYVVCAVGNAKIRKTIVEKIKNNPHVQFATLVDPSVIQSDRVSIGKGSIICAGNILTVDINIGDHVIINLDCTVGHDAVISDFVTVYPGVHISGCVSVGECTELGTGMQVIQGIQICENCILGAGSTVVRNIEEEGTYVGVPARKR